MTASQAFWQETEDWHTAGEPFRIVEDLPEGSLTEGLTLSEQRIRIIETPSHPLELLRRSLCHEPRGHAAMYGCFILPQDYPGADFSVLFWHKDGFSTACGHGIIALGYWAFSHDIVKCIPGGTEDVIIDTPSGRVIARATFNDAGETMQVDFINVTSYQLSRNHIATLTLHDNTDWSVRFSLSFAGALYACIDAPQQLGLDINPANLQNFVTVARQLKAEYASICHQNKYEIYGVCFFEEQGESASAVYQKNVVVFADGQIDRSPCGSGTCARLAVLLAEGRVSEQKHLVHESIVGSKFEAHVVALAPNLTNFPACTPRVRGQARLVGKMNFFIDPADPMYPGFLLR